MKFGHRMPSPTNVRFFPNQTCIMHALLNLEYILDYFPPLIPRFVSPPDFHHQVYLALLHSYCYNHIPHVHKLFNMHHATLVESWIFWTTFHHKPTFLLTTWFPPWSIKCTWLCTLDSSIPNSVQLVENNTNSCCWPWWN
jgi:hypothetical protein